MKTTKLSLILPGVALALAMASSSQATLVLHYTFDNLALGALPDNTAISNVTGGTNGLFDLGNDGGNAATVVASGVSGGFGGRAIRLTPANDGLGNFDAPNIRTGYQVTNGIGSAGLISNAKPYTAMAWVNFQSSVGDNFIFGGSNSLAGTDQVLHHGSRTGFLHNAHWGDDIGPDQGDGPGFEQLTLDGTWHHVAYTNDGSAGNQAIYWDGALVVGPGAAGFNGNLAAATELILGTSFGSGSYNGFLDEIRVYDTLLTQPQIQAAMTVVPEPATATLAGVFGLAGLMLRRRRSAH